MMDWKNLYCNVVWVLFFTGFTETSYSFQQEDLLQLSTFAESDQPRSPKCNVRKEFTFMSIAERMRFIQTYKTITTKEPYKSRYEALILDHPKLAIHIHTKKQFFPWHRLMLRNVEKLLQEVDRSVTLPYWDWSLSHLSPWRTSTLDIWSAQPWGLGGNGDDVTGCVTNGPFARDQWGIVTGNGGRTCLERKFNGVLPGIMTIHRALRYEPTNFTQFEDYIRNFIHDVIHWRIGGTMGDKYGSRSPEFMLHHAFLDKIWSDFQNQSPEHKWAFFKNADYKIYKTTILARNLVDNNNILGTKICYKDPFESYKNTHKALRQYDLNTVRKLMTKEAFSAPFFESYFDH
ncbi:tyrosinase tyr-1 [Paramuricea clavata]|uniref:Tyrosinase tyr-1 n=1 Tax=Paramuricea clavata TaxID=317549 RepID=A0A6S7HJV0_PARCT|nr:tyrosinase tyr-1 [Paramuricea clavata]